MSSYVDKLKLIQNNCGVEQDADRQKLIVHLHYDFGKLVAFPISNMISDTL